MLLGEEARARQCMSGEAGLLPGSRFSTAVGLEVFLSQECYLMQVSSRTELRPNILDKEEPEWRDLFSEAAKLALVWLLLLWLSNLGLV